MVECVKTQKNLRRVMNVDRMQMVISRILGCPTFTLIAHKKITKNIAIGRPPQSDFVPASNLPLKIQSLQPLILSLILDIYMHFEV